jgi:hypothetical protein
MVGVQNDVEDDVGGIAIDNIVGWLRVAKGQVGLNWLDRASCRNSKKAIVAAHNSGDGLIQLCGLRRI